jgi:hypothetical protein
MNRRGFLKMLGAGAAVTAAGLLVPDVARKFFLPPHGGWTPGPKPGWALSSEPGLNVGDVITIKDVRAPIWVHKHEQFVVTAVFPTTRIQPFDARYI